MKTFLIFTCSLIFLHFITPKVEQTGSIEVNVTNVENSKGKISAVLFQGGDGFPQDSDKAYRKISVKARENKTTFIFEDVPYGEYAISLLHDENENGKMDTNIVGYPKEGYGISNNKTSGLSMPKYENARFDLEEAHKKLIIELRN